MLVLKFNLFFPVRHATIWVEGYYIKNNEINITHLSVCLLFEIYSYGENLIAISGRIWSTRKGVEANILI